MKTVKHVKYAILSLLIISIAFPFFLFTNSNTATVSAATTKINKANITLGIGNTYRLKVIGTVNTVKWSSSNSTVASVSASGKVIAKKTGSATICGTVRSKKYYCKVTVASKYKNGVYEGSGTGFRNGTTTVSVTIQNDVITNIKILSNDDSPRFFNFASSRIISEIKNSQSADVDTVSGATYSSMGIIDAVQNALIKAKK